MEKIVVFTIYEKYTWKEKFADSYFGKNKWIIMMLFYWFWLERWKRYEWGMFHVDDAAVSNYNGALAG